MGGSLHLLARADEVLERCEVRQAFEKAPHALVAGTWTVVASHEKLQARY